MLQSMAVVRLLPLVLLLALPALGSASAVPQSPSTTTGPPIPVSTSPYCRPDTQTGVHDPDRLTILSRCVDFVGTVERAPKLNPPDGDVTLNVRPDSGYASMMNAKNVAEGGIHVEIVPRDQMDCTPQKLKALAVGNLGDCTHADVIFPPLNARVRIIGPYVLDRWVGWNEIHPAWHIDILSPTGPPPPERHTLAASMTGRGLALHKGAPRGRGAVAITVTGGTLCWRFTNIRGIGTPTKAVVGTPVGTARGTAMSLPLASKFKRVGCTTPRQDVIEHVVQQPRGLYVTVFAAGYPHGGIRGRLAPTSD
jgi:hypothetical protein